MNGWIDAMNGDGRYVIEEDTVSVTSGFSNGNSSCAYQGFAIG